MVGIAFFTAGWRFLTTEEQIGKKWRQRNGRKPTQHQRNKQYREQGSTVFTRCIFRQANGRKGSHGNHCRPEQWPFGLGDNVRCSLQARSAFLRANQNPLDHHNRIIHQHP
ncbi:Uncharacterised protein [Vibrio cholerae]|uniref:Uncharacterized protein n=1 Tax=Vibrio cholerae TaxID=666 RepID=A0A655SC35_VIBCL|nr:Uncharacterised protein [Vibrio cholerae]CSA38165.1 Uncharacterised protein [Vibrio cholerae]CSB19657.1 Uncharacterised protein [Vibrio cholerae]CSB80135.1 Uncharacterised protein [Vibrio cholerae]CSB99135.1 Uncharacterised protein [Vibrio cholerae]